MGYIFKYLPTGRFLLPGVLTLLLVLIPSCRKTNYQTDISDIELNLEIKRFEQDLFTIDFDSISENIPLLYQRYGDFFDLFNYRIINIGSAQQITYPDYIKSFLTDYLNNQVYLETMEVFPELGELENVLRDAFKRYQFHFPEKEVPEIYSFVSRFNQSIAISDGILAIGLDNYLGIDCEYYSRLSRHRYQILTMHPGKIPSDCMMGWAMTEYEFNDSVDNVLANMIYHGKMACFTKWMLPEEPDSLIMGFSAGQMNFCMNNEAKMWEYLVENKILFNTDRMTIQKFTGNGPFTSDFTHESPARAAVWLGWRIVEDYLRRNPALTLPDLMQEENYQKILALSKYNP
ncbi:hypothetical protein ACFLTU_01900 [Bacteroidota bacterium]